MGWRMRRHQPESMNLSVDGVAMTEDKTLGTYGVRDMSCFVLQVASSRQPSMPDWAQFGGGQS
jgi:hypothetical protein